MGAETIAQTGERTGGGREEWHPVASEGRRATQTLNKHLGWSCTQNFRSAGKFDDEQQCDQEREEESSWDGLDCLLCIHAIEHSGQYPRLSTVASQHQPRHVDQS